MKRLKQNNTSSKYKGVSWNKAQQRWRVFLTYDWKQKRFGCFSNEKTAAAKYNESAIEQYGEYALLNEIACDKEEDEDEDEDEEDEEEDIDPV